MVQRTPRPGVPRPDDLPPGALRELVFALHGLYRDAGMPSMRTISRAIRDRDDFRATVSHETVGQMLRGDGVPGWAKYECVVRHLAEVAVHRPDVETTVAGFHELWLAAVERDPPVPPPPARTEEPASSASVASSVASSVPTRVDDAAPAVLDLNGDLPPRNPRFVGREYLIRMISEILRTGAPIVALGGMGGVGKTQLAIEYLHRFRDDYDFVWWTSAEHPSQFRDSLARLGLQLGLPRNEASQHPPAQVLDALRQSARRWLLVLDNAGSPASLPSLAALGTGRVLLTSRDPGWARHGSLLEIGVFERDESVRLLHDRAADIDPSEADQLAARLGDLPLAVEQAAVWHQATGVGVGRYLESLDEQVRQLDDDPRAWEATYPLALVGFLNVAFAQLAETAPAAAQLLELFAWLGSAPLSLGLLRSGRQGNVTNPLRAALQQEPALHRAVRDLRRHGLAAVVDGTPPRIQVHRDFQKVLRDWLGEAPLARGRANVQAILAAANPGDPDDSRFWAHYAEVGPHVLRADLLTAQDFEVRRVALDQVRYLFRVGHYEQSIALGEQLVAASATAAAGEGSDADHHFFVMARHQLANTMRMVGRYAEARQLTLDALSYMDSHPDFGSHDEYLADLDKNRAADLRIAGRYADALVVDEASLRRQVRDDADDVDRVRAIRNNVPVNLRLLGRFAEAYAMDLDTVQQYAGARGDRDPRTLFARSNLARDLFGLGRYTDALAEVRALLPTYRDVVGENHPGVLLAVRTEVMALRRLGDHHAALRLAEENRRDLGVWFGVEHEYTLASGLSLVNARHAVGDLGTAMVEATHLVDGCERLFGARHPMTLAVLVDSAAVLRALGDLHGARRRDEKARAELADLLGVGHPYTLCASHNLAVDLALLGQDRQALDEAADVLARSAAVRGETHPDTLACGVNLALARQALRDEPAGRAAVDEALAAWEAALGAQHPQVLAARDGRWVQCDIEPPPT